MKGGAHPAMVQWKMYLLSMDIDYIYILYRYVYHISKFDGGIYFERVDFPQPFIGTDSVPEVIDPFQIVPGRALGLTIKHRLFQVSTYHPLNLHPPEFPGSGVGWLHSHTWNHTLVDVFPFWKWMSPMWRITTLSTCTVGDLHHSEIAGELLFIALIHIA